MFIVSLETGKVALKNNPLLSREDLVFAAVYRPLQQMVRRTRRFNGVSPRVLGHQKLTPYISCMGNVKRV